MVSRRTIGLISRDDYNKTKRVHTEPELEKSERFVPETSSSSSLLVPHYFPHWPGLYEYQSKTASFDKPVHFTQIAREKKLPGKKIHLDFQVLHQQQHQDDIRGTRIAIFAIKVVPDDTVLYDPVHFTQIAWFSSIGISSGPGWPSKLPSMRPCSMRLSTAHSDEAIFEFILKYDIECDFIFASSVQFNPLCFWTPFELVPRDDRCLLWWTFCLANCRG